MDVQAETESQRENRGGGGGGEGGDKLSVRQNSSHLFRLHE